MTINVFVFFVGFFSVYSFLWGPPWAIPDPLGPFPGSMVPPEHPSGALPGPCWGPPGPSPDLSVDLPGLPCDGLRLPWAPVL
jgi:hypothetical protein